MAIVTIGGIPVYDAIISDEATGMFKISLVDDPAVMSNFLAFDNNRKVVMYKRRFPTPLLHSIPMNALHNMQNSWRKWAHIPSVSKTWLV